MAACPSATFSGSMNPRQQAGGAAGDIVAGSGQVPRLYVRRCPACGEWEGEKS